MSVQPHKSIVKVTLRHWTTDPLLFVAGGRRPGPAPADREEAGSRRINLVVSKLNSIKAELAFRNA